MILTSENFEGNYYEISLPGSIPFDGNALITNLKTPVISYGADDIDNESIFFPSNVKVEFHKNDFSLLPYLYDKTVSLTLYEANEIVFVGYIDLEDINYNRLENTYKLTFTDKTNKLKEYNYDYLAAYVGNNNVTYITAIINSIANAVNCTVQYNTGESVQQYSAGYSWYGNFDYFGTSPSYFFDGTYETLWDVLKAIFSSFGLVGYFAGNKLIIGSRFSNNPIALNDGNISDKTEYEYVGEYDFIECSIRTGGGAGDRVIYNYDHRLITTKEPVKKITYNFEMPGGSHPIYNNQTSFTNLFLYIPDYIAGLGNGHWIFTNDQTRVNGGVLKSCWQAVADEVNLQIMNPRLKIKTDIYKIAINLFDTLTIDGKPFKVVNVRKKLGEPKTSIVGLEI